MVVPIISDDTTPVQPQMRRVLLTGFGAFPGVAHNVSGDVVIALAKEARQVFPDIDIHTAVLPTEWQVAPDQSLALQNSMQPDIVLHFGVAHGATGFRIESCAMNACRLAPDAANLLPASAHLSAAGAPFQRTTIPVDVVVARLTASGLPVSVSDDAGAYLCNSVFYQSLAHVKGLNTPRQVGFIHLPVTLSGPPLTFCQAIAGSLEILTSCLADIKRAAY